MFGFSPIAALAIAGILGVAIGGSAAWKVQSWRMDAERLEVAERVMQEVAAAHEEGERRVEKIAGIEKKKQDNLRGVNNRLQRQLAGLQNRPSRTEASVSAPASATCTGAQLSRQDSEFLEWEAARAQRILEEREACHDSYEALRKRNAEKAPP